jgi:hypothetical protein
MPSAEQDRAQLLRWAFADFRRFCGLLDIIPKSGPRCKFRLNAIQERFCSERTGRDVTLKPRQIGFTTLEQARDIYHFLTVPGARVVTTCQSLQDNSPLKLLSANYRVMFEGLERAGVGLKFRTQSATEWTLADRDASLRVIVAGASEASAAKKGRAGTVSRLHCTETAFYEYADDTLNALLECVPSREHGSEIVSESTANGAAGYFYKQCQGAKNGESAYKLHFYPWFQQAEYRTALEPGEVVAPSEGDDLRAVHERWLVAQGVTPEQLKWYRHKVADKGQALTDQEYPSDPETCFLVSGRGFFDQTVTTRLLTKTSLPIETRKSGRIRIYEKPIEGEDYVFALDCSEGVGGDPSGGIMYKRSSGQHVASLDGQFQPHDAAAVGVELCTEYGGALFAPERNNHGHAVLQATKTIGYNRVYRHDDDKRGWNTNVVSRPVMLDSLEDAHRRGLWTTPDGAVLAQMRKFVINDSGKAEAARGENDDLVIAAAIGWAVRQRKSIRGAISGDITNVL